MSAWALSIGWRRYRWPVLGGALVVAWLVLAFVDAQAALGGWLVAFVLWSALPIGALLLLMMMQLIPGPWGAALRGPARAAVVLLVAVPVLFLPIMSGLSTLYPWAAGGARYLSALWFDLRSLGFFALLGVLAWLVLTLARPGPVAAAGLIVLVPLHTIVAVDWLMALEPEFHSSGFGLYILSIQMTIGLCFLIVVVLREARAEQRVAMLGGLLLAALLCGLYFGFMQFFVIWSGNLPEGAAWYEERGVGLWKAALYVSGALQMAPTALLMLAPIRTDRRWILGLAAAVLAAKALELAWVALPALDTNVWLSVVGTFLAVASVGFLVPACWALAVTMLHRLERRVEVRS